MSRDDDDDDYDYDYYRDQAEEYQAQFIRESLESISQEAARSYLGKYGDAVDARISACLAEGDAEQAANHAGVALTLAATSLELMIRFLLLRPLVQGAFLSDQWAEILARRIATGRTADDRDLLPAVLRQRDIDVTAPRTSAGVPVWQFIKADLWPARDNFVHRYGEVTTTEAATTLECARIFRTDIVGAIADRLGFTLEATGRWSRIRVSDQSFTIYSPKDPFTDPR